MDPNGLILVDKPADWTSHDVVAKVRSALRRATARKIKVGHAGTLDPFATGLLILLVGSYTKQASAFLKLDKVYDVSAVLGRTSSTGDPEGTKKVVSDHAPTLSEVEQAIKGFIGEIKQVPPAHSAVKVGGKRAYKLARSGQQVELSPRKVIIHDIWNTEYKYPKLSFTVRVSSGTYIRSLVEDIAVKLGTGAYTKELRRVSIGTYSLDNAHCIDELDRPEKVLESIFG